MVDISRVNASVGDAPLTGRCGAVLDNARDVNASRLWMTLRFAGLLAAPTLFARGCTCLAACTITEPCLPGCTSGCPVNQRGMTVFSFSVIASTDGTPPR